MATWDIFLHLDRRHHRQQMQASDKPDTLHEAGGGLHEETFRLKGSSTKDAEYISTMPGKHTMHPNGRASQRPWHSSTDLAARLQ